MNRAIAIAVLAAWIAACAFPHSQINSPGPAPVEGKEHAVWRTCNAGRCNCPDNFKLSLNFDEGAQVHSFPQADAESQICICKAKSCGEEPLWRE